MGAHLYDIRCGSMALVSDHYANMSNPFRMGGTWVHSVEWENLRSGRRKKV
jgi:hypothetical protein